MNIEQLTKYYNKISECSITLSKEADFDYIQKQITKIALFTEDLNAMIGEILVLKTKMEHDVSEKSFEFELKMTEYLSNNFNAKNLSTGKERRDYISYTLMKDEYKVLRDARQELRDIESLLSLAYKKSRDIERMYPKIKTLWESIQAELKFSGKIGSDSKYINEAREKVSEDVTFKKDTFEDNAVNQILSDITIPKITKPLKEDSNESLNKDLDENNDFKQSEVDDSILSLLEDL